MRPALLSLLIFTVITGLVYPLVVTGIAQVVFPSPANVSLVVQDGTVVGSALIGQPLDAPGYFRGRPSATDPFPHNAAASSASDLSPTSPALVEAVHAHVAALHAAEPGNSAPVPRSTRCALVDYPEGRSLGFLGEPRVNVLALNLPLDGR